MRPGEERALTSRLPQPLAWAYSEVGRAVGAVEQFTHLVKFTEHLVAYACLFDLAHYVGAPGGPGDDQVGRVAGRLATPSMGHWLAFLRDLEVHLAKAGGGQGLGLLEERADPRLTALVREVTGKNPQRVSGLRVLESVVELRNRTTGHGDMSPATVKAVLPVLHGGLMALLGYASRLQDVMPVLATRVEVEDHGYDVGLLALVGTGRPEPESRTFSDPAGWRRGRVFLWDGVGAPVRFTPFAHCENDILYLLADASEHEPLYAGYRDGRKEYHPTELWPEVKRTTPFLIGPSRRGDPRPPAGPPPAPGEGDQLPIQAVVPPPIPPRPLPRAPAAAGFDGSEDFSNPKVSVRLLGQLMSRFGFDRHHFRRLHHFGQKASLTTHLRYCGDTPRFTARTNVVVARRLWRTLQGCERGQSLDAAIEAAVASEPMPS